MFGAPGAGKGTHANILAKKLKLIHISTGDLLRKEVDKNSDLGKQVKEIMDRGELVSDKIVNHMVREIISEEKCGIIFDGFPRTLIQAKKLKMMMAEFGRKIDAVISVDVPIEELLHRIEERARISNRSDDNEATIKYRLNEYRIKTMPLLDYYEKSGLLLRIDARGSIDETSAKIIDTINKNLKTNGMSLP